MPLPKKQKLAVGLSVGIVIVLAAVGVTLYFVLKKPASQPTPSPTPTPSSVTWSCVPDGQGKSMLLSNGTPCAKYDNNTQCQAAITAGTVNCSCPTGQVLQGSTQQCVPICLSTAVWSNNTCTCPSGFTFDDPSLTCKQTCSPAITADETTGKVSGFFLANGVCVDVNTVTTKTAQLDTFCQTVPCDMPACSAGSMFTGFDPVTKTCVPPNQCNGKSFYYSWPDGANTCPGFTYSTSATNQSTCVPPDTLAIKTACEYSAGGCGAGLVPIGQGEQCSNGITGCRSAGDTPTCPTGSVVSEQCSSSSKGVCLNTTTNTCGPAQYNCQPPKLPCPTGTSLSNSCPAATPCAATSGGQCVGTLVGCRPDQESWTFDDTLAVCSNTTTVSGLQLSVDSSSTTNTVTLTATVPDTYKVPLESLQFRYVLVDPGTSGTSGTSSTPVHWSGLVSIAQPSTTNTKQVVLTFYPDQTLNAVPSGVKLSLMMIGLVQQQNGSWGSSITSPFLNSANVATCTLQAAPASCLPLVGFNVSKALQLVPVLNNLSPVTAKTVAVSQDASALGLSNASSSPLVLPDASTFAGAIVPVISAPSGTTSVTQMFVILSWAVLPSNDPVTYVINKNNKPVYSGPLTTLVDVVDVNAATVPTYSLQAQTSATCTSPQQFTTCPQVEFSGQQCTSIVNGSPSLINFMIPDPGTSGCISIPSGNQQDAAYYACAYLRNGPSGLQNKTLDGLQVPSSDYTQCLSLVPVTEPVVIQEVPAALDVNGKPTGYCQNVPCNQGYLQTQRSAVCGCGASDKLCAVQSQVTQGLPYVTLSNGQSMSAYDFTTGFNGMATFLKKYNKLLF